MWNQMKEDTLLDHLKQVWSTICCMSFGNSRLKTMSMQTFNLRCWRRRSPPSPEISDAYGLALATQARQKPRASRALKRAHPGTSGFALVMCIFCPPPPPPLNVKILDPPLAVRSNKISLGEQTLCWEWVTLYSSQVILNNIIHGLFRLPRLREIMSMYL